MQTSRKAQKVMKYIDKNWTEWELEQCVLKTEENGKLISYLSPQRENDVKTYDNDDSYDVVYTSSFCTPMLPMR